MLVALEEGENVEAIAAASPAIVVPETLDPINLLGVCVAPAAALLSSPTSLAWCRGW
jgi:hypothetical protein